MPAGCFHPLDPLAPDEIEAAAHCCREEAVKRGIDSLRFNTISLKEPGKAALLKYEASPSLATTPVRQAFCILQCPSIAGAIEAIVSFSQRPGTPSLDSWVTKEGVQPLATADDCAEAEAIVKADGKVQHLMKTLYGISDMAMLACDPWSVHLPPFQGRLIQTFLYWRNGDTKDNCYAHPLDMVPIVDLNLKRVVQIDKPYGDSPPPIPSLNINYHRDLCERPPRSGLKPLDIIQPDGPSWTITGNLIDWQKWSIRISFNYREGLVLHNVAYNDAGNLRPILHRASLVEMAVPYAAPQSPFIRKCAFDVGDYGLGNCATSLQLGCDCLGAIQYFDAVLNNSSGQPVNVPAVVCMHEEDHSLLWKHVEYRTGHSESRRSRRLVLSFVATVVNYEYAVYWYFYQDGTIGYEIKLTGELSTNALAPEELNDSKSLFATIVAPGVSAQYHQHLFCMRVDFACDDPDGGKSLVVSEVDIEQVPEDPISNPAGNAFTTKETVLKRESEAQRVMDPMKGRYWKVTNPKRRNKMTGAPVSWKISLPPAPLLLAGPNSNLVKRGAFATKSLWVTPHDDEERWPAGDYTMQSPGGQGLEAWTSQDRCLEDSDPVLWLSFGTTHVPRVEDFPVMPCESVALQFKPVNFFDGNPGVDLPASANSASVLVNGTLCCTR